MREITVLSGGMGGAKFLTGLRHAVRGHLLPGVDPDATITVIANTADDWWVHGLKICPDLDTVMYTLGDGIDPDRGWGRRQESWAVLEELKEYGVEPTWFGLGDRDIATHLVRTQMLEAGFPLSRVTEALCKRWQPGVRLLPMSDDRVETHVAIADPDSPSGRKVIHFEEYWVRLRASVPAEQVVVVGLEQSTPAPGVVEALTGADLVIVPPSNPVVSVGTILGVPGIREALLDTDAPVLGLSPSSVTCTCRAWPSRCSPPSGSTSRRRAWRATTVREAAVACSTDGSSMRGMPTTSPRCRSSGSGVPPYRS
ncbi:2-phospho-L-lactate transferase [Nocardioides alcanivorans]|uniref:2-phospho-L-lactate transferase n=1 Tax=Nocardioides alcanivorans TaxID=2897352 RepID=UPI001F42605B|nr:2-phospho-L-lactate transferase [Nocardioides alcanivorans]